VNFGGVFNCTKAALSAFMPQRDGVIVNISSVMGERGWTGESNYAASKGAINAFTRCCGVELARFGIRANAVLPGFAPTDLVAGLMEKDGGNGFEPYDRCAADRGRRRLRPGRGRQTALIAGRRPCST
jgi:3-oxoacyl-[acyl-carrier protein] reductase